MLLDVVHTLLSENVENRVRTTFGFSLCAAPLLVTLVVYFGSRLGDLSRLELSLLTSEESVSFNQFSGSG